METREGQRPLRVVVISVVVTGRMCGWLGKCGARVEMCGLFKFFVGIRPELVGAGSLYCLVLAVRV